MEALKGAAAGLIGAAMPVFMGFAFAFLLEPFAAYLEERCPWGRRRAWGVALACLTVGAAALLLVVLVLPQLREAAAILTEKGPALLRELTEKAAALAERFGLELPAPDWAALVPRISRPVLGAAGSVLGTAADLALGAAIGVHILLERERVARFFRRFLRAFTTERFAGSTLRLLRLSAGAFRDFMAGQLTEAATLGLLCSLGMTAFRFPYPVAAGAVVGVTALVPVFGAWLGGGVGFLLALTESPARAALFVAFLLLLQLVDNSFIYPRIVGRSMRLEGLLVLTSVTVGGSLFGLAGMLLSVPACAVACTLLTAAMEKRLSAKHGKSEE